MAFLRERLGAGVSWPTVIIRTRAEREYRPDIAGPLSLFANRRGTSTTTIDGRRLATPAGCAAVSAAGAEFTLAYEAPVDVLNVYFAGDWVADVASSVAAARRDDLERDEVPTPEVLPRLVATLAEGDLEAELRALEAALAEADSRLTVEERTLELLAALLRAETREATLMGRLSAKKACTRRELRRRLQRAEDLLIAELARGPSLDELARAAAMSKYHLLRAFRELRGVTPSRRLAQLRVRRAASLLARGGRSAEALAPVVGFSDARALRRAFRRELGVGPGAYRA